MTTTIGPRGDTSRAESTAPGLTARQRAEARRSLVGTGVGNALEWFDWSIYATFAPFFAASFFDPEDPTSAFLAALVVFAVGFIARPVGAIVFGRMGDRLGRKKALSITVTLIAIGALMIGVSPTYAMVGVWASVFLVTARLVQGLAYGAEQPTAGAYLSERAPANRRGRWASLVYASGTIGVVAGSGLGVVLSATLGKDAMFEWGWRIPFLVAGLGGLFAIWIRRRMLETEQFTEEIKYAAAGAEKPHLWRDMWTMRRSVLRVIGMSVGLTVAYYYWVVAASSYSIAILGADPGAVLLASILANVVFIGVVPLWGILSDRIGRRPVMLIGIVGTAVLIFPLSSLIDGDPVHLFVAVTIACIFIAAPCAVGPAVNAELFPTRVRTAGAAIATAVAISLFGGTALYLQTWLSTTVGSWAFLVYVLVLLVVTGLTIAFMPETKGRILNDDTAVFTREA